MKLCFLLPLYENGFNLCNWDVNSFPLLCMCKLHVGIEELQFAAAELNWYKKQEEIMSLDTRYRAQWNVGSE